MARPTPKQLSYLRVLAERTGTTFTPSTTKAEASAEIKRLQGRPSSSRSDRVRERRAVSADMAGRGDAARVRDDEVTGYGSSARWAR